MTNVVDHPQPCMPLAPDATTMTVNLAPFGMAERYERLIVLPSPEGNHVVACLPFFSYGIQFGDLVRMQQPGNRFDRVLKSSGLRTFRFAFNHQIEAREQHQAIHGKLDGVGLWHEWHGAGYLSVLVRNHHDQQLALDCLAKLLEDNRGSWEVDPELFVVGDTELAG